MSYVSLANIQTTDCSNQELNTYNHSKVTVRFMDVVMLVFAMDKNYLK